MKKYKTVIVPERKEIAIDSIQCDLCGKTTQTQWKNPKDYYDATDVSIQLRTGYNYPDGLDCQITTVDLCPNCFAEKFLTWIILQGGTPETKSVQY